MSPGHAFSLRVYCWIELEAERADISAKLTQPALDLRLDLHRLGLGPARKQEPVPDSRRAVERGLAEAAQPDRNLAFRARQNPGSVDPVVRVLVCDHGLFPQLADQGDLLLLPFTAPAEMTGHFETVELHPVPADPDTQTKPAIRKQVDIRRLFGEQRRLPLRQDDHAGDQLDLLGDAGEIGVGDQRLVERVGFLVGTGQLRFPAGMNGAEDMVVDDDMVVAQIFRRLGKRLDRPCIAAKLDLRVNHTSFHRPFPL